MRVPRETVPGVAYHLIWQFVDRSWFFTSDEERAAYLKWLGRALEKSDWQCFAYALMSNHIHLGCVAGNEPSEHWTKRVSSPFSRWLNQRHGRLGNVIADRFKSIAFTLGREAHMIAYIHNNPIRAGVVRLPGESTWTSHRYYIAPDTAPPWLRVDLAVARTGIAAGDEFDKWVRATPGESGEIEMRAMRRKARKRGSVEVATPVDGQVVPLVCRPYAHLRADPRMIVVVAADAAGIPPEVLRSRAKNRLVAAARYVAVHCGLRTGLTGADMAAALGVSGAAVSYIRQREPDEFIQQFLDRAWNRIELERQALEAQLTVRHPAPSNSNDVDGET